MGVFADSALLYFNAGLIPIPIHPDSKKPAVKGFHGYDGKTPSRETVISWINQFPNCNLAIRLPAFIVGIDVDAYGDKKGGETLTELEKELGVLPPTIVSTSRDDGVSGIRFYRLPSEFTGIRLVGTIPSHIDVLHWGNRYAIAAPSRHPTGREYRWRVPVSYRVGGPVAPLSAPPAASDSPWVPTWADVPLLPEPWCKRIQALTKVPDDIVKEYAPKFKGTEGTPGGLAILRKEIIQDWPNSREENGWNNALYVSAKRIAELVAGGELDYGASRQSLINMAVTADTTMEGIEPTIDSGFRTGLLVPRTLQDREEFSLPDGYRATDVGNAQRLFLIAKDQARFVLKWGHWIVYDNGVWRLDDNQVRMFGMAKEVARGLHRLAIKHSSDSELQKRILVHARRSESVDGITSMIKAARDLMPIAHTELDQYPEIINVRNGEVDLRTGELHPHDPKHFLTIQAPVRYEPRAPAPVFLAAIDRWQPSLDTRIYLQRVCGSGLIGRVVEHFFVNFGDGANGKSKFYGGIAYALGDYFETPDKALIIRQTHAAHPTVKAALFGKRFVVAAETEKHDRLSEASIKDLTGSDVQTTRRMREDFWKFTYTHTLFIHTNHKPKVSDLGGALWRRIRVIPWSVIIPERERDTLLLDKLYGEAEGIFAWLVAGAREFLEYGLEEPPEVRQATAAYKNESNDFAKFLEDCTQSISGSRVKASELFTEYRKWCLNNGKTPENITRFGKEMIGLGLERKGASSGNFYLNVSILSDVLFEP